MPGLPKDAPIIAIVTTTALYAFLVTVAVSIIVWRFIRWLVLAPPAAIERLYASFRQRIDLPRHAYHDGLPDVWDVIEGQEQTRPFVPPWKHPVSLR